MTFVRDCCSPCPVRTIGNHSQNFHNLPCEHLMAVIEENLQKDINYLCLWPQSFQSSSYEAFNNAFKGILATFSYWSIWFFGSICPSNQISEFCFSLSHHFLEVVILLWKFFNLQLVHLFSCYKGRSDVISSSLHLWALSWHFKSSFKYAWGYC